MKRVFWTRRHGRIDRVRFRQILGELGVSCRQFAREAHIPALSARFSFHVWPLPSVAAALRLYQFNLAMFERAGQLAAPTQPAEPSIVETDEEVRAWQRAEAAKVIDELRAADPEREGNDAAVRRFFAANQQATFGHTQTSADGSFHSPFNPLRNIPWYKARRAQIQCWPKRLWDWLQWL